MSTISLIQLEISHRISLEDCRLDYCFFSGTATCSTILAANRIQISGLTVNQWIEEPELAWSHGCCIGILDGSIVWHACCLVVSMYS